MAAVARMDCGLARIELSKSDAGLAHAPHRRATKRTIRGIQHSVRGVPRPVYSSRKACTGSTRIARRAGK